MYDSGKTLFRALARCLHGQDTPFLGQASARVERLMDPLMRVSNRLPRRLRQQFIAFGPLPASIPPSKLIDLDGDALAAELVAQLPVRDYPAIVLGSSNGAGMHLAAALGVPWLPQTVMVPVRTRGADRDDPRPAMDMLAGPLEQFTHHNPGMVAVHQHDPCHDRLPVQYVAYVRFKWLALPEPYRRFIDRTLPRGGRIIVIDCAHRRPMTRIGERHWFQFGGLDSATIDEYFHGGRRVERFLKRHNSDPDVRRWEPPEPDGEQPEAEWGYHPGLDGAIHQLAAEKQARVATLRFSHPQDPSAFVAELYRWWYARRGGEARRLLVDQFLVTDPWLTIGAGSAPYWTLFGTRPSRDRLLRYLRDAPRWPDIRMTLFSHGIEAIGDATGAEWATAFEYAEPSGGFVGVKPKYYPVDLRTPAGFHHDLSRLVEDRPRPAALTLDELDAFAAGWRHSDVDYGTRNFSTPSPRERAG
ncbi:MAG TPA: hypothetical protein VFK45_02730 [Gammaproteobacteria bacterium]|nr:hypothetical protein [Gammaproteobacteria bacterium]